VTDAESYAERVEVFAGEVDELLDALALVLTRRAARRIEHEAAAAPCGRGATGGGLLPTLRVSSLGGAGRLCYER
jgi:hypothetical protein